MGLHSTCLFHVQNLAEWPGQGHGAEDGTASAGPPSMGTLGEKALGPLPGGLAHSVPSKCPQKRPPEKSPLSCLRG